MPKKVLIITYYWPPSGGAGVQRWLKFAKYLPEFGWEPVILTVDPAYAAYPVTDISLNNDVPHSVKVFKTPAKDYFRFYRKNNKQIPAGGFANGVDNSLKGKALRFIRGNFFIPDPRRGWNRDAYARACEIIRSEKIDHIITTSPPHSTQLIGLKLKKQFPKIHWIADLRDPWTDIYYYDQFFPTIISRIIDRGYESKVLKNSDKIITVGNSLRSLFISKVKGIENKITVITNGYDESDFMVKSMPKPDGLIMTYVGTLSDNYPVEGLLPAFNSIHKSGEKFVIRFVGTVSERTKNLLQSQIPDSSLEFLPYTSHEEAIKYMMSSSLLLLVIPLHPTSKSIITGKIFEYLATGVPVLCLGPVNGDAAEILSECNAGATFSYFDFDEISNFVINTRNISHASDKNRVRNFSRHNLTGKIANLLSV